MIWLVLLQPDSASNGPGRGGKYCSNGVDLRTKKKYTEDEAKQRAKDAAKERAAKEKGATTSIGRIPMVVRTAWEQAGKHEDTLKTYMLKLFWGDINSSPAEARAAASLADSESRAAVKNPVVEAREGSVRCNGNAHSLRCNGALVALHHTYQQQQNSGRQHGTW